MSIKYFVIYVLTMLVFAGCESDRDVVVEQQKTLKEQYFDTFQQIVADVARGNTDYYEGKEFIIRAEVQDTAGIQVYLATNNNHVLFSVSMLNGSSRGFAAGHNYTFKIKIFSISYFSEPNRRENYYYTIDAYRVR